MFSYDKVGAQQVQGQQQPSSLLDSNNIIIAKVLADNLGSQLNKSAAIMEFTSALPEVRVVPFANSINSSLHVISGDKDIEK